jgi:hypothetical protein
MNRVPWALVFLTLSSFAALAACGGGNEAGGGGKGLSLSVSENSLAFSAAFGGMNPAADPVSVTVTRGKVLPLTATSDSSWLFVTPGSGTTPQTVEVSTSLTNLTSATYTGHITVTAIGVESPAVITVTLVVGGPTPSNAPTWAEMGANSLHSGSVNLAGQNLANQLADIVYEPFVAKEEAEAEPLFGEPALLVHFQAPIVDGNDVYMITKSGMFTSCNPAGAWLSGSACGPNTWNTEIWNEARFSWEFGQLVPVWTFQSDWKPETNGSGLNGDEPVFHPADANGFIYAPGAGGTLWKVNKTDGSAANHINPFTGTNISVSNTFVSSPITADTNGNIYYTVIELADPSLGDPWSQNDVQGSWLVKVTPQDAAIIAPYSALVPPDAPAGNSTACLANFDIQFGPETLPWPPALDAVAPTVPCGSQRPGVNNAPAVGPDGTIYTASRPHFAPFNSYLIAVNPDLTPKWSASLNNVLTDGCGVLVPISGPANTDPNSCRNGATQGVDPLTNANGSGSILDQSSASPTILPDGSILLGVFTFYNAARGHLLKFDPNGNFLSSYDFGWDYTPGVYPHGDTYSVVVKDNHYGVPGLYCSDNSPSCEPIPAGPFYITQLDANLNVEWHFQGTNTESCTRNSDGSISCTSDHPNGFEWCINMPAIDSNGVVYVNSEDGNLYSIAQPPTVDPSVILTHPQANIFLNLALGAAYTPLSIGPDGKIYTQNNGHLFVVGN